MSTKNRVTIGLDAAARKAIVSTDSLGTYEYKITTLGSEITAGTTQQAEDPIKSTSNRSKKLIEPYIFELVSNLTEEEIKVLARDTRFMHLLENIAAKFESGHKRLLELRKSL